MGYDISVKFKTIEETNQMLTFINSVKDDIKELEAISPENIRIEFTTGNEIGGYAPASGRNLMISSHGYGITHSMWGIYIWLATKSEYKNKNGVPVVIYDSEEIEIHRTPAQMGEIEVDSNGIHIHKEPNNIGYKLAKSLRLTPDFKKEHEILTRINNKYEAYRTPEILILGM